MRNESFQCLSCRHSGPHEVVLELGKLPLGNTILKESQLRDPEPRFPLDLAYCDRCSLLQLTEPISAEALMGQYLYFTSVSPSLIKHGEALTDKLSQSRGLGSHSLVADVGSNDGSLLGCFLKNGIPVLGIEPIEHSAKQAEEIGVPTVVELFSGKIAGGLRDAGTRADVIISNYVLELIPDLPDFVSGLRVLLKDDGVAVLEVPYVKDMVDKGRFDCFVHVRLTWFSLTSLDHLFRSQGLTITDVEHLESFRGGTLRIYASLSGTPTAAVTRMLEDEKRLGMNAPDFYRTFADHVYSLKDELRDSLSRMRQQNKTVAAYGGGIKASTVLNFCALDHDLVDFVVDGNPYKQGHFMPGVHLPIYSPDKLKEDKPDYVLLLALDFTDEVLTQQRALRQQGGRFIIPANKLQIV